jgi:hypothetical protein
MGGLALSSILNFTQRFDDSKEAFFRLHRQAPGHPTPCALATPDGVELSLLTGKWHRTALDSFAPPRSQLHEEIEVGLCSNSNVYGFLKYLMKNSSSMLVTRDPASTDASPTYQLAEDAFLEKICYGKSQNTDAEIFGDVRERITRAYIHSSAAFVKLSTGCSWLATKPFGSTSTCPNAGFVQAELTAAAKDIAAFGFAAVADSGEMLYRLAALAVLAYRDRTANGGLCFSNENQLNASEFCQQVYDEVSENPTHALTTQYPATDLTINGELLPPYEVAVRQRAQSLRTCADAAYLGGAISNPPSPPPAPMTLFSSAVESKTGAVKTCTDTLEWGLFDTRRLFGVPDPRGPFEVKTSYLPGLIDVIYSGAGLSNMQKTTYEEYDRRDNELRQYASYRMVATAVVASLVNWSAGFFLGRATIPLFVFVCIRCLGVKSQVTGDTQKLVPPPPRLPFFLALFVAIFAWVWAGFVDPAYHLSPFYIDGDCGSWRSGADTSAPWSTTSSYKSAREAGLVLWFVLVVPVWGLIYNTQLRGFGISRKRLKKMRRYLNPKQNPTTLALIPQTVLMTALGLTAVHSSKQWFKVAVRDEVLANPGDLEAEDYSNDLTAIVFASVFSGWVVGAMTRRWAANQSPAIVKLPFLGSVAFSTGFPALQNFILLTNANDRSRAQGNSGDDPRFTLYIVGLVAQGATLVLALFVFQAWLVGDAIPQTNAVDVPVADEENLDEEESYEDNTRTTELSAGSFLDVRLESLPLLSIGRSHAPNEG